MANISTLYHITACAGGVRSQDEINKAISPRGLLEHIINFFTFDGVRKSHEELYRQIESKVILALKSKKILSDFKRTGVITLNNIQGNNISFTLPGKNNENGMIIVTVSNGKDTKEGEIPSDKFTSSLAKTKMMLKQQAYGLSTIEEGNEDEALFALDGHYIDDNQGCVLNTWDCSVDSDIREPSNMLNIDDVNRIIKEGGIFSVSSKDAFFKKS